MSERRIAVVPEVASEAENLAGAQELAWGHAVAIAALQGEEVGSDSFLLAYDDYLARYMMCSDHIGFLQHVALGVVREVLHERVALMIPKDADDDDITELVSDLAHVVVSAIMWTFASFPHDWLPNAEWDTLPAEARAVTFPFTLPTNIETEKKDDNDD